MVRIIKANIILRPGNRKRAIQNAIADETTAAIATVHVETTILFMKFPANFF